MGDESVRRKRQRVEISQDDGSLGISDVHALLNDAFIDEFIRTPLKEKYLVLIQKFNQIWRKVDLRPETIASTIRNRLGDLAPPNVVGAPFLPIPLGFKCHYKAQLALLGLHTSPMMGICNLDRQSKPEKRVATAIVVNGGYADDVDRGSIFIYVGEGGEQSGESQALNRGNLGLLRACRAGNPVRVIRGYRAHSRHAPSWGFRYDGLYEISTGYWDVGMQDRRVWKFVLRSTDESFTPVRCGCSEQHVIKHEEEEEEDVRFPLSSVIKVHKKAIEIASKQTKDHQKVQSTDFDEPKRIIKVISSHQRFDVKVSQLLLDRKCNEESPSRLNLHYKLPSFQSFSSALHTGPDKEWSKLVRSLKGMSNTDALKPAWARYGFMPFMLKLTTELKNGRIEELTLPINRELKREHAVPYFPQSTKDNIKAEIDLRPPFGSDFDPWTDVSQGVEDRPIRCINNIDDVPPPTEFTYIKKSIAFSGSPIDLVNVCSGCVPLGVDTSAWEEVPKKSGMCRGLMDPDTGRVYCNGSNHEDLPTVVGDCGTSCPCKEEHCRNRVWKAGVQFRVSIVRMSGLGWGVIADEKIPANSFVVEYAGDVINFGEMQARVHKYETNGFHNFCFEIFKTDDTANEFWKFPCVDSLYFGNVSRLINHSCDPNLVPLAHYHHENGGRCLSLFTLRDILIGEQLTYDYGNTYTEGLKCLCGAKNCRILMRPEEDFQFDDNTT